MRILLATYPVKTIFQPMVPLAWALRTAGHEVRVASQPWFADEITRAGLTAVPVGRHNTDWRELADRFAEEVEAGRAGLPSPYDAAVTPPAELDWDTLRAGYQDMVELWHKRDNFPLVAGLVEFARQWQPDLVVWEAASYAGAIAARACGAAHARLLWSIDVFGVARERFLRLREQQPAEQQGDPLGEWLGGYARKYGFEFGEDLVTGQFSIDPLPDSLRMAAEGLDYVPVRYTPYGGRAVVPKWLQSAPARPRVGLTLGTSATEQFGGYTVSVQDILESLSDVDVEVVATVAESEQHKLGRIPDNARVVSFVPLDALAATCSVVINHTGPGTFLTTARHGVPQLNVPWDFDEPELARRAEAQGGSLVLRGDGHAVREPVLRLLHDPELRRGAAALRDDILALPSPNELVGRLEELTNKHRTAVR